MKVILGIFVFFMLMWYGLKIFLRYGLPWLLARFFRNQQARYGQGANQTQYNEGPDGEVQIRKDQSAKPSKDDGFGEYVDFEDVDDN